MQICELLNFTPFFRFPGALGPWNTSKISDIMAGKLDPNTDIAVLTDDELKELIQRLGLEFPRKANRPMLIALLRGSKDSAPVSHANPDVASLCAALSELTGVVRELKSELKTMKDVNVQLRDSDREIQALKDDVQKLRRELHAEQDHQFRLTHVHADPGAGDTTHLRTSTSSTLPMHFSTSTDATPDLSLTSPRAPVQTRGPAAQHISEKSYADSARQPPRPHAPGHDKRTQKPNHRREETSRYTAPKTPKSAPGLVGRPRVTVYYIGNVDPDCDADSIAEHCKAQGVSVVQSVVYTSVHFRTASARITVLVTDAKKVAEESFWPDEVGRTVREWRFGTEAWALKPVKA